MPLGAGTRRQGGARRSLVRCMPVFVCTASCGYFIPRSAAVQRPAVAPALLGSHLRTRYASFVGRVVPFDRRESSLPQPRSCNFFCSLGPHLHEAHPLRRLSQRPPWQRKVRVLARDMACQRPWRGVASPPLFPRPQFCLNSALRAVRLVRRTALTILHQTDIGARNPSGCENGS
jgi:hypothetical protein